jgi:hypothetical protein
MVKATGREIEYSRRISKQDSFYQCNLRISQLYSQARLYNVLQKNINELDTDSLLLTWESSRRFLENLNGVARSYSRSQYIYLRRLSVQLNTLYNNAIYFNRFIANIQSNINKLSNNKNIDNARRQQLIQKENSYLQNILIENFQRRLRYMIDIANALNAASLYFTYQNP